MSFVPLTQAVTSGDASVVSAVLANGADVNERTGGGQTPLILATIFNHTHLIRLLLEAGADPSLRDNLGLNAIDWAQRRGATEAIELFSNKPARARSHTDLPKPQGTLTPQPQSRPASGDKRETSKPVSEAEKGQRWLAGLKQRIAEQSQREMEEGTNIFHARPEQQPEPAPEPQPEPAPEPAPEPVPIKEPDIKQVPVREPEPAPQPQPEPEPQIRTSSHKSEHPLQSVEKVQAVEEVRPSEELVVRRKSGRKRCPKCNAIYNSDLVAYCAHHIVPLVDDDEPIISEPSKPSPVLFWMLIVITLTGSVVIGSLMASYFYHPNKPSTQTAASAPELGPVQKGLPGVGAELDGTVISLPVAECPLNGQEPIPGTVTVRITVDRNGRVKAARASGGDWLLRDAATKAARNSTFSPEKLRGRETEGTITYTFEP
ncbi:MAG TPA: TonB family protein [Pyrinomonadaceae bacterium]|nr:TonB family protein [Pyrinomonadaceae bacterium]